MNRKNKSGRKKDPGGVQATIERLTGIYPCPKYLRDAANKYLKSLLFPENHRTKLTMKEKLRSPNADVLIMNALQLDEVFKGNTAMVVKIINSENSENDKKQFQDALDKAEKDIQSRFEVYAYWVQHIGVLKSALSNQSIDLKNVRLDEVLKEIPHSQSVSTRAPLPFALRAIQQLESIEKRGRLGRPTADELAEQADAYMALRDFNQAGEKAREALEVDPTHAHAWFVRVMAALQLRNSAFHTMKHHQFVAQEIADPMSSQESMAWQLMDDESDRVIKHHEKLNEILPQALLHWPLKQGSQYDYAKERAFVRDLFIDEAFSVAISGKNDCHPLEIFAMNGIAPEWALTENAKMTNPQFVEAFRQQEYRKLPFNETELKLLTKLICG